MSDILETYFQGLDNVIIRDSDGNPGVFVKHPMVNSRELFDSLPDHPHPAFVNRTSINSSDQTYSYVLYSKYNLSAIEANDRLYSLPNAKPARAVQAYDYNGINGTFYRTKQPGTGITPMTIADYGFLSLLTLKNNITMHGNTRYGVDSSKTSNNLDVYSPSSKTYNVGDHCYFRGWEVECLISHTSSTALLPCDKPTYWKYIRKAPCGGTILPESIGSSGLECNGITTLTGSGPIDWYLNSDLRGEADLIGGRQWLISDYGINYIKVNNNNLGVIEIIPYNMASNPEIDVSNLSNWRTICIDTDPNNELGYTYEPFTDSQGNRTGYAENSLAWSWEGSGTNNGDHWELTRIEDNTGKLPANYWGSCTFQSLKPKNGFIENNANVLKLMYELGILPIPGVDYHGARTSWRSNNTYHFGCGQPFGADKASTPYLYGSLTSPEAIPVKASASSNAYLRARAMGELITT